MTSYSTSHTASDIAGIVIDFIVEIGIQWIAFAALIALVLIAVWLKNQRVM